MKTIAVILCELWFLWLPSGSAVKSSSSPVARLPIQVSPSLDVREHSESDSNNDPIDMDPLAMGGMERVESYYPCYRPGHFMPPDGGLCARLSIQATSVVRFQKKEPAKIPDSELRACPPKTAVLLTGLMRDWEPHIESIEKSTLEPCNTDLFITTDALPSPLKDRLGARLKDFKEAPCDPKSFNEVWGTTNEAFSPAWCQWLHLSRAWKVMTDYEDKHSFKYDVVFKQRSDMAIQPPAYMTFVGWEEADKVHMMTDMLFWAKRPAFEKVAAVFSNLHKYFMIEHPDPWVRELNIVRLLDSLKRDPFFNALDKSEGWGLYQKINTLPYPDMGQKGAVPNLEAAVKKGDRVLVGKKLHCGDFCNPGDYQSRQFITEKDILQWVINQDLTICDLGASANLLKAKGTDRTRKLARNC